MPANRPLITHYVCSLPLHHPTLFFHSSLQYPAPCFSPIPLCIFPSNLNYKSAQCFFLVTAPVHALMLACCLPSSRQCTITGPLALITMPGSQEALISLSKQLTLSCELQMGKGLNLSLPVKRTLWITEIKSPFSIPLIFFTELPPSLLSGQETGLYLVEFCLLVVFYIKVD